MMMKEYEQVSAFKYTGWPWKSKPPSTKLSIKLDSWVV